MLKGNLPALLCLCVQSLCVVSIDKAKFEDIYKLQAIQLYCKSDSGLNE